MRRWCPSVNEDVNVTPVRQPRRLRALSTGSGTVLAIVVPLGFVHDSLSLATPALLLLVPIVLAAVVGGRWPSIVVAFCAALAFNIVFIPPAFTLQIRHPEDVLAYVIFIVVAAVVGTLVSRESDRRRAAELSEIEMARINRELIEVTVERERLATEAQRVAVLEAVGRQRSALLRSVSHDLRTPLVTIRGVSSDLRSGAVFDSATRNDLLDLVISEAERLDRLVSNLLSFSRIESGTLVPHVEVVEFDQIVDTCTRRLRRLFDQSALDVALEVALDPDLPLLLVDPGLVDQVLTNLLENAVRHGGGRVRLAAKVRERTPDGPVWVTVTVDDDGPGIGDVDRQRLFEPWNTVGRTSSSGVGLAICRSFVEAHGGKISVDDTPSGGARFSFTLPVFVAADERA